MKSPSHVITWMFSFAWISCVVAEPDADPFAITEDASEITAQAIMTSGGFKVSPIKAWDADPVRKGAWPPIEAPITFNANFTSPSMVWRVNGGYLASFDSGEFGASLFYADTDDQRWTRLLNTHVQSLVSLGKDVFVVAGGLAHLTSARGEVHLLIRTNKGGWTSRKIIDSSFAVPSIVGTSKSFIEDGGISEKLAVIAFNHELVEIYLYRASHRKEPCIYWENHSKRNRANKSLHPTANRLRVEGVVTFYIVRRFSIRFGRSVELYVLQKCPS